jgi:parvulin-like peptidyl-prolyl isomerase
MKRIVLLPLLALAAGSVFAQILDRPVALVQLTETVPITQRELRQQISLLESQLGQTLSAQDRQEVLEAQIGAELINQAADRDNIRVTDEELASYIQMQRQSLGVQVSEAQFRDLIQDQFGLSWDQYVQQSQDTLIQQRYVVSKKQDLFDSVSQPSPQEVRQMYEENATQFTNPAMVRFTHVFVDTRNVDNSAEREKRERAEELYRRIRTGAATFDELVDQSVDDASYSAADFGYLLRTDQRNVALLGKSFVDAVFAMERGDTSGVLESNVGYHVVKVTDRRKPRILELDDPLLPGQSTTVRDQIRAFIVNQRQEALFNRAVNEVVAELREEAEVTVFEENLDW